MTNSDPVPDARDEVYHLRNELGLLKQKYLELQGDLDRVRDHREAAIELARREERERLLLGILEAIDAIESALQSDPDRQSPWFRGTVAIYQHLASLLDKNGVERIVQANIPFDPAVHEAVSLVETPSIPDDTVVEVLRAGYRFADGVLLRPARVLVSRQPRAAWPAGDDRMG